MSTRIDSLKDLFFHKDASGTGIFSTLGLNAYNLEQEAKSLVPYLFPLTNSIPRVVSEVGGPGVNWKAVLQVQNPFITVPEAVRAPNTTFLEKDYQSNFKTNGAEVPVSWFAQETGRGFQDNQAFAQFSALNSFLTSQERKILYGNSGPSGNGYALGTAVTPVASLVTGGSIPSSTVVSLWIVGLTPFGMYAQSGATTGITPQLSAVNTNGTTVTASGGTSIISAGSNSVQVTGGNLSVSGTWTDMIGANGYAVFVNSTDATLSPNSPGTLANAVFATVVDTNAVTITALPAGTNQKGNAAGLNTDYSFDANDFDGLLPWTKSWSASGTQATGAYAGFQAYYQTQNGGVLHANGDSTIQEFNTIASYLYDNFKTAPDAIWVSPQTVNGKSMIQVLTNLMLAGSSGAGSGAQRIILDLKEDGGFEGGKTADAYLWPYSYNAKSRAIPVETHPWLPNGTILFQMKNNPYPQAAGKIPAAFELHALRDTFSIVWPFTKLQTEVGVYNFLTTKNYLPHTQAVLQNIAG